MAHVGGRIRTLRAERQLTLDELADKSGLSKGLLSKLENNTDANPSLDTLHKLADAFDVTVGDLLEGEMVRVKRYIPETKPVWVDAIAEALRSDGKQPDEDIMQALYVLQSRKGSAQRSDMAWVHMYRSLELNFRKNGS